MIYTLRNPVAVELDDGRIFLSPVLKGKHISESDGWTRLKVTHVYHPSAGNFQPLGVPWLCDVHTKDVLFVQDMATTPKED